MTARDAETVARAYLAAVNAGDVEAMASLCAPGFVHHSGAGDLDVQEVRRGLQFYRSAFSDFRYELEDLMSVEGGDAVVARWTMRGTHTGRFFGAAPTGRSIASGGLSLHRVVDGLLVEDWEFSDDMGLMRGLGFRVDPPAAEASPA